MSKTTDQNSNDNPLVNSRWRWVSSMLGPFLALAVVVTIFGLADKYYGGNKFMTMENAQAISVQTAVVAVAALGMTVIIISGGIDLSAGTAIALCATVLAWGLRADLAMLCVHGDSVNSAQKKVDDTEKDIRNLERRLDTLKKNPEKNQNLIGSLEGETKQLKDNLPGLEEHLKTVKEASPKITPYTPWLAVPLSIITGCLCGLLNGAVISYIKVVPFIVTLGTMKIFLGVSKIIADETTVRPSRETQIPVWLDTFLSTKREALYFHFPLGIWVALALSILLAIVLKYTVFSRSVFALGSNEATARLCGINVEKNKIAVYVIGGLFVGIAGLYQFARLSVGNPTSGIGLELNVIAAVVIGGGSLSGGRGTIIGTVTGAIIMAVILSGCTQLGISNPVQDILLGAIIVVSVIVDQLRHRQSA